MLSSEEKDLKQLVNRLGMGYSYDSSELYYYNEPVLDTIHMEELLESNKKAVMESILELLYNG